MKKKLLMGILSLVGVLCLCLGLAACGGFKTEGTYYLFDNEEYDMDTYFILKNGKWSDQTGASGDYKINGDTITFYSDLFGEKMELTSGTIKDGILTMGGVFGDKVYAQMGAAHIHEYGEWVTQTPSTCTERGTEVLICKTCGKYRSRSLPLAPHPYGEWEDIIPATCTESGVHKHICTVCSHEETVPAPPLGHEFNTENKCVRYEECGTEWEYTDGLSYTLNSRTDTYTVSGIGTASGDVVIPYVYDGKPVTAIEGGSYYDARGGAFDGCSELTSITIPGSVTSIWDYAFYNCSELESVTIEYGVTSIGQGAFKRCTNLTSITIPDSVTEIAGSAFNGTAYYNDASHWENGEVLYIGNHLIEAKDTISGAYSVRLGTKTIAVYAFYHCIKLTSITIPAGVTSIGALAFQECVGLESVTIGSGVTSIGSWAFSGCVGLESITIPDSVTSIGSGAFDSCVGLTSISIPDSVTSIEREVFEGCENLTDIHFTGLVREWRAIKKDYWWDGDTPDYIVTCADGTIKKDGTVTYFK